MNLPAKNSEREANHKIRVDGITIDRERLLDMLDDAVVVVGTDFKIAYANSRFVEGARLKPEEVLGRDILSFFKEADRLVAREALEQVIEGTLERTHFLVEMILDGKKIYLHIACSPLKEGDRVDGAVMISRDVTESEEMRQELDAERQRYRILIESMQELLVVLDAEGRLVFCNYAFHRFLGYSSEESLSLNLLEIVHPEDRVRIRALNRDLFSGRRRSYRRTMRIRDKQGTYRLIETSAIAVGKEGQVKGVQWIGRDVTERERHRLHLTAALKELEKRQELLMADVRLASLVHRSLLPKPIRHPAVIVDTLYTTLIGVGGDYVNLVFEDRRKLKVAIFDVTGHGLAASLLANRLHSEIERMMRTNASPPGIISGVNDFVREHFEGTGLFLTLFCLFLEVQEGILRYSGAGHLPAILREASGKTEFLYSRDTLVGALETKELAKTERRLKIKAGDAVVLYTDGFADRIALPEDGAGIRRLKEIVRKTDLANLDENLCRMIFEQVEETATSRPLDDMTLLVVKYRGKKSWGRKSVPNQ